VCPTGGLQYKFRNRAFCAQQWTAVQVLFSAGVGIFCHDRNLWTRKIDGNELEGIWKDGTVT
jgi:hypothetical protein